MPDEARERLLAFVKLFAPAPIQSSPLPGIVDAKWVRRYFTTARKMGVNGAYLQAVGDSIVAIDNHADPLVTVLGVLPVTGPGEHRAICFPKSAAQAIVDQMIAAGERVAVSGVDAKNPPGAISIDKPQPQGDHA